jgi:hypothetical protein
MTVQARVIFTRFGGIEHAGLSPWLAHTKRVLGKLAPPVTAVVDPTVWQLVSANNREMARSAVVYSGFRAASDAVSESIAKLPSAVVRTVVDEGRGLHGWYLAIDGEPAVICSRWYFADRERSQAVALAVASLAVAVQAEGARLAVDRTARGNGTRVH